MVAGCGAEISMILFLRSRRSWIFLTNWDTQIMTLRVRDWQEVTWSTFTIFMVFLERSILYWWGGSSDTKKVHTFIRGSLHSSPISCWVSNMPSTLNDANKCTNWTFDFAKHIVYSPTSLIVRILFMSTLTNIFTRLPTSRGGGGVSCKVNVSPLEVLLTCSVLHSCRSSQAVPAGRLRHTERASPRPRSQHLDFFLLKIQSK